MRVRITPLGFLPGDIEVHSHCMFVYSRKDESYFRSIAGFLSAGLNAGEMCICAVHGPELGQIEDRMVQTGADLRPAYESGQFSTPDAVDVYMRNGCLDTGYTMSYWREKLEIAERKWKGLRVFGDLSWLPHTRTIRLKLLAYEALVNIGFSANLALCGYQSSTTGRSFLVQAKNTHPFVASSRSVQRNSSFVEPSRFLAGLYRLRYVRKVYPADPKRARDVRKDLEDVAARTPLTVPEIEEMKVAASEAFANAVEHGSRGLDPDLSHVHVIFAAEADKFVVVVKDHGSGFDLIRDDPPHPDQLRERGMYLIRCLTDRVSVDRQNGDTIVTMQKRYSIPLGFRE